MQTHDGPLAVTRLTTPNAIFTGLTLAACCCQPARAAVDQAAPSAAAADTVATVTPAPGDDPLNSTRDAIATRVSGIARWVDAYFDDPNYTGEEADARLELRQLVTVTQRESAKPRTRVRLRLSLPRISRRANLVFEGNDSLSESPSDEASATDDFDGSLDDPSFGLEYFQRRDQRLSLNLGAGVRFGNQALYVGPRVRYEFDAGSFWLGRLSQRIRWYTGDGWESRTRAEMDRAIGKSGLFRQRLELAWVEEDQRSKGVRLNATTGYTHILANDRALRYGLSTEYRTQPHAELVSTRLSVSYRQRLWRDWIHLQITPFLSWEDRFDWQTNPGVRVSISVEFEDETASPRPDLDAAAIAAAPPATGAGSQ